MRAWLTLLAAGASLSLASCATAPTQDPWADIELNRERVEQPTTLPEWPQETRSGEDELVFDLAGAHVLRGYRITAEGNQELAEAHADQIDADRIAIAALVEAGRAQRRVAELRREILDEERRAHMIEKIGYYVGMVLVIAGAAVL